MHSPAKGQRQRRPGGGCPQARGDLGNIEMPMYPHMHDAGLLQLMLHVCCPWDNKTSKRTGMHIWASMQPADSGACLYQATNPVLDLRAWEPPRCSSGRPLATKHFSTVCPLPPAECCLREPVFLSRTSVHGQIKLLFSRSGDHAAAEAAYSAALELCSEPEALAVLHSNRAAARIELGQYPAALQDAQRSRAHNPCWDKASSQATAQDAKASAGPPSSASPVVPAGIPARSGSAGVPAQACGGPGCAACWPAAGDAVRLPPGGTYRTAWPGWRTEQG